MDKCVVLFFILFSLKALSQDTYKWVNIDCGSATSYRNTDGILWQSDEEFIQTGTNKQVSPDSFSTTLEQMNSLRVFTQQNKNCYTLPSNSMDRYFIRTMFKYGNYDGLSNAPTFDLEIDGNKIMSIHTVVTDIVFSEVIYTSRGDNISVCLARTRDKEYPFISSLEAWPLDDDMYAVMNRDLAWTMSYRYNYGTEDWIIGYPGDKHNRMWEPATPQDLNSVVADTTTLYYTAYEEPPESAVFDASEAQSSTDSITLSFPNGEPSSLSYSLMYFTEMRQLVNDTRSFDVYVDGDFVLNHTPEYQNCSKVKTYAHPEGNLKIELRPTTESTLPPIISAIEVYTASDALVTIGTSQDDLDGLGVIIRAFFDQLKGWTGEPCLPSDTTWQWLGCVGNDPPRVTSLNLSAYGLVGPLPTFSQMQRLESIDLSSNNLNGSIPDFLGKLPNLKLLDLHGNKFSGKIPQSIASNKNIKLSVDGNLKEIPPQNPPNNKGKKAGLIIGLVVGLFIAILVIAGIIFFYLRWKKSQAAKPETEPEPELEIEQPGAPQNPQEEASISINASTDPMLSGPQQNGNNSRPRPEGENFTMANGNSQQNLSGGYGPVNGGAGEVSGQPSMIPEIEMDELDHLVQQHASQSATGRP